MKRLLRTRLRRQVVLTLKTGESFTGVLFDVDREALIMRNAAAIGVGERGDHVPVDGEILVMRADVAYLQLP